MQVNNITDKGLSIIVPVYNEIKSIESTCQTLVEITKKIKNPVEVIFVNDASNDGTHEVLNKYDGNGIKVVTHQHNKGYGAAIKTGIRASMQPYIAITDADGTYPNNRIPELFQEMLAKDLDMIVGARTGENVNIPLVRKPAKWVLNSLANYFTNIKIPDMNSGLRIMNKETLNKFENILPNGFSFTTTITLGMLTRGYNVEFIPINYGKRQGKSKIRPIHDTLNFLQLIIRTILYFDPLKIFIPVSFSFMAASSLMILYRMFFHEAFGTTSVILFITGVQLLAIGMLADLIDKRVK